MGGRIAIPLDSAYHGTKFALEGLSESLQYEVEPFGIKIILIEPGAIKSNFFNNLKMASKAQRPDSPYTQMMQKLNAGFSFILENAPPPVEVARVILKAVTSEHPELRYPVGDDAEIYLSKKNYVRCRVWKFNEEAIFIRLMVGIKDNVILILDNKP